MFFDGKIKNNRNVSLGGKKAKVESTKQLIEDSRKQREEREIMKRKTKAINKINAFIRRVMYKLRYQSYLRNEFDRLIQTEPSPSPSPSLTNNNPNTFWKLMQQCVFFYHSSIDNHRLEKMIYLIANSLQNVSIDSFLIFDWNLFGGSQYTLLLIRFFNLCILELISCMQQYSTDSKEFLRAVCSCLSHILVNHNQVANITYTVWKTIFCCELMSTVSKLLSFLLSSTHNVPSDVSPMIVQLREISIEIIKTAFKGMSIPSNFDDKFRIESALTHFQKKATIAFGMNFLPNSLPIMNL